LISQSCLSVLQVNPLPLQAVAFIFCLQAHLMSILLMIIMIECEWEKGGTSH